jgi:hypothetical protein
MPFHFIIKEDLSEFKQFKSVLIIPCRFCPAASSAVSNSEQYIKLFSNFLKTDSYEKYINDLKSDLENRGIRTSVFRSKLLHQFVLCMWTSKRRMKLSDHAKEFEALIVLGCEAAVRTIQDSVKNASCQVFQGLEAEGIMSIQPRFNLPCNISLELQSVTHLQLKEG